MEGNRDEALKCYHLAEKFLSTGHEEKSLKFVNKSIKLYSTPKAEELLKKLKSKEFSNGNAGEDHTRKRRRTNSGHRSQTGKEDETHEPEEVNYTQDQVHAVLRIKNCKDYYEVLGVNKDCEEKDLKKSYRKLALQFHPDKNKAPGASEAFKRIGNAYSVLSDNEKRRRYDQYGENLGPSRAHRNRNHYEDEFEGDISPEDLFNMFFGGGFANGRVHVRRGGRTRGRTYYNVHEQHQQNESVSSMYPLVQILPVLLIVLFSLLSSFLIPEPIYSFQQTSQYRFPITTGRYHIQYFVKEREIRQKYSADQFDSMERKIEREFIDTLQVRCYRERQYIAELNHQARLWGSSELLEKANNYRKESCERLQKLVGHA